MPVAIPTTVLRVASQTPADRVIACLLLRRLDMAIATVGGSRGATNHP
jgi:hypothetical protein